MASTWLPRTTLPSVKGAKRALGGRRRAVKGRKERVGLRVTISLDLRIFPFSRTLTTAVACMYIHMCVCVCIYIHTYTDKTHGRRVYARRTANEGWYQRVASRRNGRVRG